MNESLLKKFFTLICLLSLVVVLLSVWVDRDREWKQHQKAYYDMAATMAKDDAARKGILDTPLEIKQIQTEVSGRVDRCTTCHMGVDNPNFLDAEQPFRTHPSLENLSSMLDHSLEEFGCSFCHDGQGLATTTEAAHGRVPHWDRPLLTSQWLDVACGRCHKGTLALEGAPVLTEARKLVKQVGCYNCHKMEGFEQEETGEFGPDLTAVGLKMNAEWLVTWLKEPFARAVRTKMLKFYLTNKEAASLSGFLMSLKGEAPASADSQVKGPEIAEGKKLFREFKCFFCHRMEGFEKEDMAPDLTGFGNKHALDLDYGNVKDTDYTLQDWTLKKIREPRAFETKESKLEMPGNDLKEDQLIATTILLLGSTGEEVPKAYRRVEVHGDDVGKRLFDELSCVGCHNARSMGIIGANAENVAKDLSSTGEKVKVAWMFEWLKDPSSILKDTKMPTIGSLTEDQVLQVTAYVMGFRQAEGPEAEAIVAKKPEQGMSRAKVLEGREVFETMECYRCHRVAGRGGQIAPELTRVGEKVREDWLLEWFTKPENYNLNMLDDRPIILSSEQIEHLVSYLLSLTGGNVTLPRVPKGALMVKEDKQEDLDELEKARALFGESGPVKYLFGKRVGKMGRGCYGCHRLGDQGSDIGPDLSEQGNKVSRDWLGRWLKDPGSYLPESTMGDFRLTDEEIRILADYLMTFRRQASGAIAAPERPSSHPRG